MSRLVLADTETTGVSATDKVCEVAWRHIDADGNTITEGSSLINPGMPIHYAASAVNGITDAMVADAPSLDEYMEAAGQPLLGDDVIFVAHNAAFDRRYLKPYLSEGARTLCTLKCAQRIYPDAANHKQGTLATMLGIQVPREKAHSADGDLDVLAQLLIIMARDAGTTIEGLLEVQARPRTITTMGFGKHRGKKIVDLPNDYVDWLLNKAEKIDDELRASLISLRRHN